MDLYVIDTPLQLLNAVELRQRAPARAARLVLLEWPTWPPGAFRDMLAAVPWTEVRRVAMLRPPTGSCRRIRAQLREYVWSARQFLWRRRVDRALAEAGAVDRLVVGNLFNEYMRHAASRVDHGELWAVDDGTDTLRTVAARRNGTAAAEDPATALGRLKLTVRRRWLEWDGRWPSHVRFFTAYDFPVPAGDVVERNDYRWLRGRIAEGHVREDCVWVLGQPLAEDGYLAAPEYRMRVSRIATHYGRERVVYVPHKREAADNILKVATAAGVEVRRFERPIELELALGATMPTALASFFCSALENCAILFGDSLNIVAIDIPEDVLQAAHEDVAGYYRHLRSRQTPTFRVENLA